MSQDQPQLRHTLKNRHVSMIALGGTIGAGLFVSSGAVLNTVGPAAWLSYAIASVLVILIMRAIGEMAVLLPGARSLENYPRIALGRWAGFSVGWMYWYFWVIIAAIEAVAGASLLGRYFPVLPNWAICLLLIVVMTVVNLFSVKSYAEAEFWLASVKVFAIIFFVAAGLVYLSGVLGNPTPGVHHLTDHGGFFPKGVGAAVVGSATVLFSFTGAEIATIAASESEEPAKYAAQATRQVTVRVLTFYLASIAVIIMILPWDLPMSGASIRSPFALALNQIGIPFAEQLMDVVVLTAVLSSLNSCLYLTSRVLFSLSRHGDAPKFLVQVNKRGVPARAIVAATLVSYVSVVANYFFPDQVFTFLINSSGAVCLIYYFLLLLAELKVRRLAGEHGRTVKLRMWGFPYLSWIALLWMATAWVFMIFYPSTRWQTLLSALSFAIVLGAYQVVRRRTTDPLAQEMVFEKMARE